MLARITGVLESVTETTALLAPPDSGVAYELLLPRALAEDLADQVGALVTLHTLQHLESQGQGSSFIPRLIGFASRDDRRFFELLNTVKGVGAKKALRVMAAPPSHIARAIADRDVRALQELPEVGKRLAETIVAELSGKVEAFVRAHEPGARGKGGAEAVEAKSGPRAAAAQAIAALVTLGEARADAERMVRAALEADAGLETADALLAAAYAARAGG